MREVITQMGFIFRSGKPFKLTSARLLQAGLPERKGGNYASPTRKAGITKAIHKKNITNLS